MGAMVRLKSKNKIDNQYAYRYYAYLILSMSSFLYGIHCWFNYSKFVGLITCLGGIVFFFFKNSYADYSSKTKCTHPNNLEDFIHAINIDADSRIPKIWKSLDSFFLSLIGTMILLFGLFFIIGGSFVYADKNGLETPTFYIVFNNLLPVLIISGILILGSIETNIWRRDISDDKAFAQNVSSELIQKIEHVKFPMDGQKQEFAKKVSEYLKIRGKITRLDLFNIASNYLEKNDKETSIDFLSRISTKEESE